MADEEAAPDTTTPENPDDANQPEQTEPAGEEENKGDEGQAEGEEAGMEKKEDKKEEEKEEKPAPPPMDESPSAEELPQAELDAIVEKSLEILKFCQEKVDEEKLNSHSLTFMLLRVKENMDSYNTDYLPMLNTFLVAAEGITADYYARLCCRLPKYGDVMYAIKHSPSNSIEAGGDRPVGKDELFKLVAECSDNAYATAMLHKSLRAILKDINNTLLHDRRDMLSKLYAPFPDWLGIQDNVNCQLEGIREQTFKITSYIDFLKQGEAKASPVLDVTKELKERVGNNNK